MDQIDTGRVIELLIEYFEAGNRETDTLAKMILQSSSDYKTYWQEEIQRIHSGIDWTGIRAVEADILIYALQHLHQGKEDE